MLRLASYFFVMIFLLGNQFLFSKEICISTPKGECYILDVNPTDSFLDVTQQIQDFASDQGELFVFEVLLENEQNHLALNKREYQTAQRGSNTREPRDFYSLSSDKMQDIHFIITTLANKSLASIFSNRSLLEAAGDRIENVHPLRFLFYVFSDEELKVGFHNIRNKKWVWKDFSGGIKESLTHEFNIHNIKDEHINYFAEKLEINAELIRAPINRKSWDELFDILITHIPRKGDHRRYDN